jgi:threonine 3-dehydrogenase
MRALVKAKPEPGLWMETWYKMSSMIRAGLDATPIITHHFDANDFQEAFDTMRSGESGKVILNWS